MRTSDATSPVPGKSIAFSLTAAVIVYIFVFGAASYYILQLIGKGPEGKREAYGDHGVEKPPIVTDFAGGKEDQNV
jgi:cytochrome d ubiquinol oxidase subunit I